MNDSQSRRQELLRNARLNREHDTIPAIHPGYRTTYQYLYSKEPTSTGFTVGGTLGIRSLICILIFAAFLIADHEDMKLFPIDCAQIQNRITADLNVTEMWKEL